MRTVSRWVGAFGAVVGVAAAVVMGVATFLPYTGGNWGDGLLTGNEVASTVTMNIVSGSDAWFVLGTVVILGVCRRMSSRGISPPGHRLHRSGGITAVARAGTQAPRNMEAGRRGVWRALSPLSGFYVFLGGAVTAVFGALLMVAAGFVDSLLRSEIADVPVPFLTLELRGRSRPAGSCRRCSRSSRPSWGRLRSQRSSRAASAREELAATV